MRLLLLLSGLLFTCMAHAINILPPTVQPERQITRQPEPVAPYAPADLLAMTPNKTQGHTSSETVFFTFNGFVFEGASLVSEQELLPLYQDKLGTKINLATLYAIADAVESVYLNHGYILTRVVIPAQEIDHGDKIKILVIEGYIDEIDIETDNLKLKSFLMEMAEPILRSDPLKFADLESALLRMNDLPGVSVKSLLSPSLKTQGASRLIIEVDEQDYELELHVDNRGTIYTGPTEYLATVSINNPGGYVSQTQLEGTVTDPTHEMSAANLTHIKPFGEYGTYAQAALNYSQVNPGASLAPLDVHGYSSSLQLTMHQPIVRQRRHNLSAWMGYDILRSKTNAVDTLLYIDHIESIRAGFSFDVMDDWQGTNIVTGEVSRGVNLITGENEPPLLRSRVLGTKDYTKANASYTRLQNLPWNFGLFLSGQAQYAANPLLAAEEYGVGGLDYGLAYDYFEIAGDSGYAGRAELRRSFFPNKWMITFIQPYISYDGGQIFQKELDVEQSLTSLGGGLRFDFTQFFFGQVEVAKPLTRKVAATDSKDPRGFFYFTAQF